MCRYKNGLSTRGMGKYHTGFFGVYEQRTGSYVEDLLQDIGRSKILSDARNVFVFLLVQLATSPCLVSTYYLFNIEIKK